VGVVGIEPLSYTPTKNFSGISAVCVYKNANK